MWFKNKQTGLVWEVINEDSIKRCQNDDNYEVVEKKEDKPKRKATSKKK